MRLSRAEQLRRYQDHNCVSALGPGWNEARAFETVCGICGLWFYWDTDRCVGRKTRRKFKED